MKSTLKIIVIASAVMFSIAGMNSALAAEDLKLTLIKNVQIFDGVNEKQKSMEVFMI